MHVTRSAVLILTAAFALPAARSALAQSPPAAKPPAASPSAAAKPPAAPAKPAAASPPAAPAKPAAASPPAAAPAPGAAPAPAASATPLVASPPAAAAPVPDLPDLTPEQRQQIQARHGKVQAQVAPLRQELHLKRQELRAAWAAEPPKREVVIAKLTELDAVRQKIRQIAVEERVTLINLLTREQRAAIKARRARSMGTPEGMGPGWGLGMSAGVKNLNLAAGVDDCPGLDDAANAGVCAGCTDAVDAAICMSTPISEVSAAAAPAPVPPAPAPPAVAPPAPVALAPAPPAPAPPPAPAKPVTAAKPVAPAKPVSSK